MCGENRHMDERFGAHLINAFGGSLMMPLGDERVVLGNSDVTGKTVSLLEKFSRIDRERASPTFIRAVVSNSFVEDIDDRNEDISVPISV